MGNLFFDEAPAPPWHPEQLYWTRLIESDYWCHVVGKFEHKPQHGSSQFVVVYDPTLAKRKPGFTCYVSFPDQVEPVPDDWRERLGCNG